MNPLTRHEGGVHLRERIRHSSCNPASASFAKPVFAFIAHSSWTARISAGTKIENSSPRTQTARSCHRDRYSRSGSCPMRARSKL